MAKRAKPIACDELGELIAQLAIHYGKGGASLDNVVPKVQGHFKGHETTFTREVIGDAVTGYMRTKSRAEKAAAREHADELVQEAMEDRKLREEMDKLDEAKAGVPPQASTPRQRRQATDAIRQMRKQKRDLDNEVNGKQRAVENIRKKALEGSGFGNQIDALVNHFYDQGITEPEAMLDAVHDTISEVVPDGWTREDTRDAISHYGQFQPAPTDPKKLGVIDIKARHREKGKLRDMGEGIAPKATGKQRPEPTAAHRELIAKVNDAKKRFGYEAAIGELKSKADTRRTVLRNQIADYERQIGSGVKDVRTKPEKIGDPKTLELEQQRDALKAEYDRVFDKKGEADRKRAAELQAKIDDLNQQIANRNFKQPKPKPQRNLTPELAKLEADLSRTRRMARLVQTEIELTRRLVEGDLHPQKKPVDLSDTELLMMEVRNKMKRQALNARIDAERGWSFRDLFSFPNAVGKMMQAAYDASYPFRQGGINILSALGDLVTGRFASAGQKLAITGRSIAAMADTSDIRLMRSALFRGQFGTAAGAFGRTIMGINTEADLLRHNKQMEAESPQEYALAHKAGLPFSEHIEEMEHRHNRVSHFLRTVLPVLKLSDFAFAAAGNRMRFDLFRAFLTLNPGATLDHMKVAASLIGDMTLRAKMDAKTAAIANEVFFSARALKGRINWWTMDAYRQTRKLPNSPEKTQLRKWILGQQVQWLMASSLLMGIGHMLGFAELDPRSSDFMKLKFGNTRVDPWSGLGSLVTLVFRSLWGETKPISGDHKGEIMSLSDETDDYHRNLGNVWLDWVLAKLSPAASGYTELMFRKEYGGKPIDPRRMVLRRTVPLFLQEMYQLMQREGMTSKTALTMLAFLGMGVRDYDENEELPDAIIRFFGGTPNQKPPPKEKSTPDKLEQRWNRRLNPPSLINSP